MLWGKSPSLLVLEANERDTIQTAASARNLIDIPIKKTLNRLLDVALDNALANDATQPHLVLMVYSRATSEMAAALQQWKTKALTKVSSKKQFEELLAKAVTVVTLGAASNWFPDGPAYIHVSMCVGG